MTDNQKSIFLGISSGAVLSSLYLYVGWYYCPFKPPTILHQGDRLVYAIKCDAFACFMYFAGIGQVALRRFFTEEAIQGEIAKVGSPLDIDQRYLQNTLEQFILLLVAHLGLSLVLPIEALVLIPVLVSLFIFARLAFWIGYHKKPTARALGFVATFYPSAISLFYVLYKCTLS